jgi:tRNA threonylcarbamoyladenosine biosynthesis protein TsaB
MYSLILDSSTKILYVCLVKDKEVLYEKYVEGNKDHAKNIVYLVNQSLEDNKIEAKDLDEIVCGYGPGSYTGVRMAVTVCKMLSVFMHKPLYTISSLKLMASGEKGIVLSTIDARRGNVFGCILNTNTDTYIIEEAHTELATLSNTPYDIHVSDDGYRVDPFYVLDHKVKVENPDLLVPNYLRETEAERNLHDKAL